MQLAAPGTQAAAPAAGRPCALLRQLQAQRPRARVQARAQADQSQQADRPDLGLRDLFMPLGDGDAIPLPAARSRAAPNYEYSKEQAVEVQLAALAANDKPYPDHGIEVLYRFSSLDPFQRSAYFGKSFDLGQFERFRRIVHTPAYRPLLNHERVQQLSSLRVSERCWKLRLLVSGEGLMEEGRFEFTMVQRQGSRYDGFWFTESLVAEGSDWAVISW